MLNDSFLYLNCDYNGMSQVIFEKEIMKKLSDMEKGLNSIKLEIDLIKERLIDDTILSEDDKKAIDEALKEEKEGRLLVKERVFV